MAEIRCPMCSRPNPEERDTCEFCGARLKPLTGPMADANVEPIHPGEEPTQKSTSELEKTLPEWLRNLRKSEQEQEGPPIGEPAGEEGAAGEEDFRKDLSALGAEGGAFEASSTEPAAGEEPPAEDYLGRLSGLGAQPVPGPAEEEQASPAPAGRAGEDLLAGLSALEAESEAAPAEEPVDWLAGLSSAQGEEEEQTPDWLQSITGKVEQQAPPAAETPAEGIDWQSQLEQGEKAAAAPPPQAEPAWKGFLGETEPAGPELTEQGAESAESLDWLKDLEAQAAGATPPTPAETPPAEETPDWLRGLPGQAGAAVEQAGPPEEVPVPGAEERAGQGPIPAEEQGLPGWLAPAAAGAAMAASRQEEPGAADETPDWLKGLESEVGQPETPAAAPSTGGEGEIPDWLKTAAGPGATIRMSKPEEPATPEESAAAEEEPEIPDWLKAAAGPGATIRVSGAEEPATPEESVAAEEEPGVPDWLKSAAAAAATLRMSKPEEPAITEAGSAETEQPLVPAGTAPETGELEPAGETPDWLKGLAAGAAVAAMGDESKAAEAELFPTSMPDWLAEIKPAEEAAAPAATPAGEEPIEQAQLPSWVQAMRPVEAAVGETAGVEEDQFTEEHGPLSGFSNVLPAASGAAVVRKVSAYPNKLLVNESQQGQMELLERLVSSERTAKKAGTRRRISSNRMLRWGIAVLLLASVLLPIVLHTSITPSGKLNPPPLNAAIKAVNDLQPGATVLVVVDYQPAFSAEMESAATPLLDHLRLKGATVVFISSSATGSALADRLVARVDQDLNGASPEQYLNLGYLTGGSSGITSFVTDPAQTAPKTIDGAPAWQLPPLQDIRNLSDFSSLVVLTDSSDTGAIWIEQSRIPLGDAPLLMALSAQAEPMLQPYFDSGQVQGMVTGLPGGVAYEQSNGIPSVGSSYWDPFSVGFLVADIIIVFGGVAALLLAWQARRPRPVSEAQ